MKKITLQNYTTDTYYSKIVKAVASILASETVVTPIKLFVAMELLKPKDVDRWRKGQVPYLEKPSNAIWPKPAGYSEFFASMPMISTSSPP